MRILILGSTGQLSLAFQNQCQNLGLDYVVMGRRNVPTYHSLDFLHLPSVLNDLSNFDVVINTIAYTDVYLAQEQRALCFQTNAYALEQLLKLLQVSSPLLIHFSSDYVYGHGVKGVPKTEETIMTPLNVYGQSKALGDQILLDSGYPVWIFRTAGLYDPSLSYGHFQAKILKQLKEGQSFGVYADQYSHRTSATYLASRILFLLLHYQKQLVYDVYHLVEPLCMSWYEWAIHIAQEAGMSAQGIYPTQMPTSNGVIRPRYGCLSMEKLSPYLDFFG